MKPKIVYVDDEPKNLLTMENILDPDDYELRVYSSGMDALKELKEFSPHVVISDQKMPGMSGLDFLLVVAQLIPDTPRIILTGQTDEETMVKLVKKAQIFDYLVKPVINDDVLASVKRAAERFELYYRQVHLLNELELKTKELEKQHRDLLERNLQLEQAQRQVKLLLDEATAWAGLPITEELIHIPTDKRFHRDLVCITFDLIGSSQAGLPQEVKESLNSFVVSEFTTILMRHNGIFENHLGDNVYGHFGAFDFLKNRNDFESALAVAQEFKQAIRHRNVFRDIEVECGIAIHFAPRTAVIINKTVVKVGDRERLKKTLMTSGEDVNFLFTMEKSVHELSGSNIIISDSIASHVPKHMSLVELGAFSPSIKCWKPHKIFLVPSDRVTKESISNFVSKWFLNDKSKESA